VGFYVEKMLVLDLIAAQMSVFPCIVLSSLTTLVLSHPQLEKFHGGERMIRLCPKKFQKVDLTALTFTPSRTS